MELFLNCYQPKYNFCLPNTHLTFILWALSYPKCGWTIQDYKAIALYPNPTQNCMTSIYTWSSPNVLLFSLQVTLHGSVYSTPFFDSDQSVHVWVTINSASLCSLKIQMPLQDQNLSLILMQSQMLPWQCSIEPVFTTYEIASTMKKL